MSGPIDLKKFFVDPETFSATTDGASLISGEIMTEAIFGPMPQNFRVERAAAHFSEIIKAKNPQHPMFMFVLTTRNVSSIALVAAFKGAVDTQETCADIATAIDRELSDCGRNPDEWRYEQHSFSRNIFPSVYANFQNWKP